MLPKEQGWPGISTTVWKCAFKFHGPHKNKADALLDSVSLHFALSTKNESNQHFLENMKHFSMDQYSIQAQFSHNEPKPEKPSKACIFS